MKKIIIAFAAAAALFTACEEFQPVFTGKYQEPEAYAPFDPEEGVTGTDKGTFSEIHLRSCQGR